MQSSDIKTLNRLATHALRFKTTYFESLSRVETFVGHSPRKQTPAKTKISFSSPKEIFSLSKLAHLALDANFVMYPETPISVRGMKRPFLQTRSSTTTRPTRSELAELNRMARLVEMTSDRIPQVPVYACAPTISSDVSRFSQCVAAILGFTQKSNPSCKASFDSTFPKTEHPRVSMFSGQPRINRDIFNALLCSKLSELRSKLGISSTPKGAPALVASFINSSLSMKKPKPRPTKTKKTSTSGQKVKKTKVDFTTSAQSDEPHQPVPSTSFIFDDKAFTTDSQARYPPLPTVTLVPEVPIHLISVDYNSETRQTPPYYYEMTNIPILTDQQFRFLLLDSSSPVHALLRNLNLLNALSNGSKLLAQDNPQLLAVIQILVMFKVSHPDLTLIGSQYHRDYNSKKEKPSQFVYLSVCQDPAKPSIYRVHLLPEYIRETCDLVLLLRSDSAFIPL
jgi:hypothetical protein